MKTPKIGEEQEITSQRTSDLFPCPLCVVPAKAGIQKGRGRMASGAGVCVVPAKAGIQKDAGMTKGVLDSRLRGNDGGGSGNDRGENKSEVPQGHIHIGTHPLIESLQVCTEAQENDFQRPMAALAGTAPTINEMNEVRKNIYVTEPFLPPLEAFLPSLQKIWHSRLLTNGGPFHEQFEQELARHLGVEHLSLFANGTLALITALQALRITGEVITTPYSFVATAHSLLWNGLKPVFVDIDPKNRNINPDKIEEFITPNTSAILPVHCYGIPCDTQRIEHIADTYGLKVLYDAAHSFGVRQNGRSVLLNGDLSILSFHATKVFNTFEGGAIICRDAKIKQRIDFLKNFGFADETTVVAAGINGKMNEFSAALGLLQLQHVDEALALRAAIFQRYTENLKGVDGIEMIEIPTGITWNYAYCPIYVKPEHPIKRDELYACMKEKNIHPRRYFYPLVSEFPMYRALHSAHQRNLQQATAVSRQILCLPIYPALKLEEVDKISQLIKDAKK